MLNAPAQQARKTDHTGFILYKHLNNNNDNDNNTQNEKKKQQQITYAIKTNPKVSTETYDHPKLKCLLIGSLPVN